MKLICISNTSIVELHYLELIKGVALSQDTEPKTYNWLKIGKIYEPDNLIGKVFMQTETGELIDAVIIDKIWLPASLFMRVEDWREQQLNKIL
jgi:uncharacterized protein YqgQ